MTWDLRLGVRMRHLEKVVNKPEDLGNVVNYLAFFRALPAASAHPMKTFHLMKTQLPCHGHILLNLIGPQGLFSSLSCF